MGFSLREVSFSFWFCCWVLGCLLTGSSASFAGLEEGIAAYEQGDYSTAFKEFELLAKQGNPKAQIRLGEMYIQGKGVPLDYTQAGYWIRKSAEQGNPKAQSTLGYMYFYMQDYIQAEHWYHKAAGQGDVHAQDSLGLMYYKGKGVSQDYTKAAHWYRKAAEQGNAVAQHHLGLMYNIGKGVPQNHGQAVYWCRKAAEQGDDTAQAALGSMYAIGRGVPQNYVEAHKWLNLAAAQGTALAKKQRDELANLMTPAQIAKAQRLATNWHPGQSLPATSPVRPTSGVKKNLISDIQKHLNTLGYEAGPVDGMLGPRTKAAIRKFQGSLGVHPTGQPSQELLVLLKRALDDKSLSAH